MTALANNPNLCPICKHNRMSAHHRRLNCSKILQEQLGRKNENVPKRKRKGNLESPYMLALGEAEK